MTLVEIVQSIKQKQNTIDSLLSKRLISLDRTNTLKWILESLYMSRDCTISFAYCSNIDIGSFPEHCHPNVKEFIVCIEGSVDIWLNEQCKKTLKRGDFFVVKPGVNHVSKPLEENTKLLTVCVPGEFFNINRED